MLPSEKFKLNNMHAKVNNDLFNMIVENKAVENDIKHDAMKEDIRTEILFQASKDDKESILI